MIQIFSVFDPKPFKLSKGVYTEEHVGRMVRMLEKHVTIPYEFNVIKSKWPGWWGKIELFKYSSVFYLDLSTAIVKNIDDLLTYDTNFMACRDFIRPDFLNSKIMSWKHADHTHVYDAFAKDPERYMAQYQGDMSMWGDQSFINHRIGGREYFQDVFPGSVESYKNGVITDDTQIIGFHGKPKPEETEYWKV